MEKQKFEDGVYDIPNHAYHGAQGYSRSALLELDKSPYHFWYAHLSGKKLPFTETSDMKIGSVVHTLLLEPNKFEEEFAVAPNINKRTNKGKEEWAEFEMAASGKIVMSNQEYERAMAIVNGLKVHGIVNDIVLDAKIEQSIFWTDKETGLQFKCRPDVWHDNFIVDVKTAKNVEHDLFARSALDSGYYVQAGMMFEALEVIGKPIEKYLFLCAEKVEPYAPKIFVLDRMAVEFGIQHFQVYKKKLAYHLNLGEWPGYEIENLRLPHYARNKIDLETSYYE